MPIEFMKVCEYSRSRSFLDLGPMSFTYENQNLLLPETTGPFLNKFYVYAFRYEKMKIYEYDAG